MNEGAARELELLLDAAEGAGRRLVVQLEDGLAFHRGQVEVLLDALASMRTELADGTLEQRYADAPLGLTRPYFELSMWPLAAQAAAEEFGDALAALEDAWSVIRPGVPEP